MTYTVSSGTLNPSIPYSVGKVKNVNLLFADLLLHKLVLHNYGIIVPVLFSPPKSPDLRHTDRSQLS